MNHQLTTARLALTPAGAADLATVLAHWRDAHVRRFLFDDELLAEAEVTDILTASESDFATHGYGLWLARDQGALIGTVGLRPLDDLGIEVTYSLDPSAWGLGYATEMAGAVIDHAFTKVGLTEVLAEIDEGNIGSRRVVEKLGMVPFATVPGVLGAMIRYRLRK